MKRVVIKLGGSVLSDDRLKEALLAQLADLRGCELILVHGGGKQIAALLKQLGVESRFHDGLRITDAATRDVAQMVLAGKVGKDLVADLAGVGLSAASITGGDGLSFLAQRMAAEDGTDLGYVGQIVQSDWKLVTALLGAGIVPVIACLGLGAADQAYYNINGDQMAAAVAAAGRADDLVFVTDVGGVLDAEGKTLAALNRARVNGLLASGIAHGGMRPKLRACLEALAGGVKRILIVGAAEENVLLRVLNEGEPLGTRIA